MGEKKGNWNFFFFGGGEIERETDRQTERESIDIRDERWSA